MPGAHIVNEHVEFPIMLPQQVRITIGWTGYFTSHSKPLANTDFTIVYVSQSRASGKFAATTLTAAEPAELPSSTVRLFAPGYVQ